MGNYLNYAVYMVDTTRPLLGSCEPGSPDIVVLCPVCCFKSETGVNLGNFRRWFSSPGFGSLGKLWI